MSLKPGIYRIASLASGTNARAYKIGGPVFVSNTLEYPGPFELFDITLAEGGYHIKNVGLDAFVSALPIKKGTKITISHSKETKPIFEISKEDTEAYIIKIAYEDLLWTVQPPIIPRGDIQLEPANGEKTQQFAFKHVAEL